MVGLCSPSPFWAISSNSYTSIHLLMEENCQDWFLCLNSTWTLLSRSCRRSEIGAEIGVGDMGQTLEVWCQTLDVREWRMEEWGCWLQRQWGKHCTLACSYPHISEGGVHRRWEEFCKRQARRWLWLIFKLRSKSSVKVYFIYRSKGLCTTETILK